MSRWMELRLVLGLTPVNLADMSARLWEDGALREWRRRRMRMRKERHVEVAKNELEHARGRMDEGWMDAGG